MFPCALSSKAVLYEPFPRSVHISIKVGVGIVLTGSLRWEIFLNYNLVINDRGRQMFKYCSQYLGTGLASKGVQEKGGTGKFCDDGNRDISNLRQNYKRLTVCDL